MQKDIFKECDVVFLSYDEPEKEQRFQNLKKLLPDIEWVDGVEGLDKAHRACAEVGSKNRVVIIDGDNALLKKKALIPMELLKSPYVLSFVARNSINGLTYGNGGIKCWPRELLKNCQSHELKAEGLSLDFVHENPYYQVPELLSVTEIHHNKAQAFRAGFREAIKMALVNGKVVPKELVLKNKLETYLSKTGLYRLRTWLKVGRDIPLGEYALLGARRGLSFLYFEEGSPESISEYQWLSELSLSLDTLAPLLSSLNGLFSEPLEEYDATTSKLYKSAMVVPLEKGLIQKHRELF